MDQGPRGSGRRGRVDLLTTRGRTRCAEPYAAKRAEGGLQFAVARRALDLENLVVAALGHARVHPRHFRRSVVKSDPVTHDASKKMHPRGFGPRGLVAIENGMAKAASPRLGRLFVLLVVVDLGEFRVD